MNQSTTQEKKKLTIKDFKSAQKSTWCPGCGDFGILSAVQMALVNAQISPWEVLLVSGIGCGSKLPDYINANGYMTLHGRAVTIASGAHLANTALKIFVISGDGDGLGIGAGHAFHNMRRNIDIVHLLENNEVYGLTKGQYSPTSKPGFKTSTSPEGSIETPVNPALFSLTAGATFIARGFSGDPKYTASLIQKAVEHKGYAIIDILQTCPSYQKGQDSAWYKAHIYKIEEKDPNYDSSNLKDAFSLLTQSDENYPIGIIYQVERPTYAEQVPALLKSEKPLVEHNLEVSDSVIEKIKTSYV